MRKTEKNISQDSQSPDQDLNLGPPVYEAGVLTTRPLCSALDVRLRPASGKDVGIGLLGGYQAQDQHEQNYMC
jgi:hypothetical protein